MIDLDENDLFNDSDLYASDSAATAVKSSESTFSRPMIKQMTQNDIEAAIAKQKQQQKLDYKIPGQISQKK